MATKQRLPFMTYGKHIQYSIVSQNQHDTYSIVIHLKLPKGCMTLVQNIGCRFNVGFGLLHPQRRQCEKLLI